jgi:hypothetical protein
VDSRTAHIAVAVGVLAALVIYLGGPSFFVLGLPLGISALVLGLQSLRQRRTTAGYAACGSGLVALLIPVAQFALQS